MYAIFYLSKLIINDSKFSTNSLYICCYIFMYLIILQDMPNTANIETNECQRCIVGVLISICDVDFVIDKFKV